MKLRMSEWFIRWFLMAGLLIPSVCLWDARAAETAAARLFDPTIGSSPVETLRNVDSISLSLANHPVVVEVSGPPR